MRGRRLAVGAFAAGGTCLALAAAIGLVASVTLAERVRASIPGIGIDAAAVGGAMAALAVVALALGIGHLVVALLLARAGNSTTGAIVLATLMALLLGGGAAAAWVSAAAGSGFGAIAAGVGLVLIAAGYALLAAGLIGARLRN